MWFLHFLTEALLQREVPLQLGYPPAAGHAAQVLILLVKQPTFSHQLLPRIRVRGELPRVEFILRFFETRFSRRQFLLQFQYKYIHGWVQKRGPSVQTCVWWFELRYLTLEYTEFYIIVDFGYISSSCLQWNPQR